MDAMDSDAVKVRPASVADLDALLPLVAQYQAFYNATPEGDRNRQFFRRFIAPSPEGLLLGAWDESHKALGFACIYWTHSSVSASDVALLNDLLVVPDRRSQGIGRMLVSAAITNAREHGCSQLRWQTAPDNQRAQRLYNQFNAQHDAWLEYTITLTS
jgi:GNAT superfamily N-acetyltransferase